MFEDRTTENLKKETLAEIEPATGVSSMAGSYADATVGPLCQAVSRLYKALPGVLSMLFVDESSGRFLDLVGGDYFDLTRREGTKARCSVTLTGKAGTVVNAGTVFLTAEGLEFVLLSAVTIGAAGTALGELEAAAMSTARGRGAQTGRATWPSTPASMRPGSGRTPAETGGITGAGRWRSREWGRPRWWSCPRDRAPWG